VEVLPGDAGDEAILAAVRRWIGLLAAEEFEAAVESLHPGAEDGIRTMSAAQLRERIAQYEPAPPLSPGPSRVTPAETAGGPFESIEEVYRTDDGTPTSVDFSVPVNGEWSELTAFFDVHTGPDGLALSLTDIYVN
jgi:hypothetical protein